MSQIFTHFTRVEAPFTFLFRQIVELFIFTLLNTSASIQTEGLRTAGTVVGIGSVTSETFFVTLQTVALFLVKSVATGGDTGFSFVEKSFLFTENTLVGSGSGFEGAGAIF